MTLGIFSYAGYAIGCLIEHQYRGYLDRLMALRARQALLARNSPTDLRQREQNELRALRRDYSITLQEETTIIEDLDPEHLIIRRADLLLEQLQNSIDRYHALNQPMLQSDLATRLYRK